MKIIIHEQELFAKNELKYVTCNFFTIGLNEMRFIDVSPQTLLMLNYTTEELLAAIPQEVIFDNVAI